MSEATIYRWAAAGGWASSRARRRDAGRRRCGLTDQHLDLVAGVVRHSQRADGRLPAPVSSVVETLQAAGALPAEVSTSTVCRQLRDRQQSRRELQAKAVWTSRRCEAGEIYQLDSSPALAWHLEGERGFRERPAKTMWAAHKPETWADREARRHLIRYACVDKASNLWVSRYAYATGETPADTIECLLDAFGVLGVPLAMTLDRGAGNVAYQTRSLLWLLGIEVQWKGSSKNALGSAEDWHARVQQRLEWRWAMRPPTDLVEANARLLSWWRDDVRVRDVRQTGHSRLELYSLVREGTVRQCPPKPLLRQFLHARPEQRDIDGEGAFSYRGQVYLVDKRRLRNVSRAWVAFDPWDMPHAVVLVGYEPNAFACEERIPARMRERDEYGFWADAPRWGLGGEHPVGTRLPEHEEGLRRAGRAATAAKSEIDWYADLPEAVVLRGIVERRGGEVGLDRPVRLVPVQDARYRVVQGIWDRHRREPAEAELATLRSWEGRDGVEAEEIAHLIEGNGRTAMVVNA